MESSRKRKAAPTPSSSEGSGLKKLKLSNSAAVSKPAAEDVQGVAAKLLEHLKRATDKTGRLIATQFLELPDPEELPDYYQVTKLPLAVETIEEKLKDNAYTTITALESDFKRMVQNAKDYNAPKSEIYEDSERVRKLVYNFMKNHNPEYKRNPDYHAVPTPLPEDGGATNGHAKGRGASERSDSRSVRRSTAPKASEPPSERKASIADSASAVNEDADGDGDDGDAEDAQDAAKEEANANAEVEFTGKSFQAAQSLIISHLMTYTDAEEGLAIYQPFEYLPSRKLEDYYQLIRHPVSLRSVEKRIQGIHGRAPPTNITDFKSWDQFEDEVSWIWRNAQSYNEDESDMYNLATEFKEHFQELLAQAKEKVELPSAKLKLGGPKPKVTLNLSQQPRASPTPGMAVDNEALLRQRQMVQAGVNGQHQPAAPHLPNGTSALVANGSAHLPAVKSESTQSPAPQAAPLANGMMPPPSTRPTSGSPYPAPYPSGLHFTAPAVLPPLPIRAYPIEDALLPSVTITSHPQLNLGKPLSVFLTPHETQAQQSATVTVSPSHYFLQIAPTISRQLSMGRPYKLFVTVNGTRMNQRDTIFHADSGKRSHIYEASLAPGVNRVEVEVVSSKLQDGVEAKGLDIEKVTCFVHLQRA